MSVDVVATYWWNMGIESFYVCVIEKQDLPKRCNNVYLLCFKDILDQYQQTE